MLRKLILFFVKLGWLKKPKQHLYAVETIVKLDGRVISKFPVTTTTYTRKWARRITLGRIRVKTATTATRSETNGNMFIVPMNIYLDGILSHVAAVEVPAKKRREAKFEITKRLKLETGNCARVDHLKKYNKKAF